MKLSSKIFFGFAALTVSSFGFISSASAGVGIGGVAGSAAFSMTTDGKVTEAAVSAAVGKDTAYAGATNNANGLEAFAVGTGGVISFTGDSVYIKGVAEDSGRDTAQANDMGLDTFNINATADGTKLVDIVPTP